MNLSDIFAEIYKNLKSYGIAYGVFNLTAIIVLLLMPLEYTAKSSLSASNLKDNTASDLVRNPFSIGSQGSDGDIAIAINYISSKEFIFYIVEKYSLHEHYLDEGIKLNFDVKESMHKLLKNKIKIEPIRDQVGVYSMSVTSYNREFSKDLLKKVIHDLNRNLAFKDYETSQKRIDYLLEELNKNTNDNLKTSLTNLLNDEIKTKSLSQAVPEEYILKLIDEPFPPKERSSPGSRTIFMIVLQILFVLVSIFFVVFKSVYTQLYQEFKEKIYD